MAWQVFKCRDTGAIWLRAGNTRHLIPTENTRKALYDQYPVAIVPSESSLAGIPIGPPRGTWPDLPERPHE